MIGHRMAKLNLHSYTPGSYLSTATVEYNEDPGPEHSVMKSITQLRLSVFTPSLENLFSTLPPSSPKDTSQPQVTYAITRTDYQANPLHSYYWK